jgi:hypothetical protein
MNHKFQSIEIPEGQISVQETCACGVVRVRYAKGGIRYLDQTGLVKCIPWKRCDRPQRRINTSSEMPSPSFTEVDEQFVKTTLSNDVVVAPDRTTGAVERRLNVLPKDTNAHLHAAVKDQAVIIRLMFDEMIKQGLHNTHACQMAGRWLYCNGYRAVVETVCPDQAYILSGESNKPVDGRSRNGRRTLVNSEID